MATTLVASGDSHLRTRAKDSAPATPWQFRWPEWRQILARTWKESGEDNIGIVAAGVAFYAFLAIVPMIAAIVLLYGLIVNAAAVLHDIRLLADELPRYAATFIAHQLVEIVTASTGKKGLGLLTALGLTIFGARNGAAAVITALNIAYEENETRSWLHQTLLVLAMTVAGVLLGLAAVLAAAALGHLRALLPNLPAALIVVGQIFFYAVVTLGAAAGIATLYRYGPSRIEARWEWLTPGSLAAASGWLLFTLGFGIFVAKVNDYSATYGSLSTIVVLLTWLYLSSYMLLLGAELNSEVERQTGYVGGFPQMASPLAASSDDVIPSHGQLEPAALIPGAMIDPVDTNKEPRSLTVDAVTVRAAAATTAVFGLGRVGALQSVVAAGGLVLLRRRGHAKKGGALLVTAGLLAFIGRR